MISWLEKSNWLFLIFIILGLGGSIFIAPQGPMSWISDRRITIEMDNLNDYEGLKNSGISPSRSMPDDNFNPQAVRRKSNNNRGTSKTPRRTNTPIKKTPKKPRRGTARTPPGRNLPQKLISESFVQRYRNDLNEVRKVANQAGSRETEWNGQIGRLLTHVEPGSLLEDVLELKKNDIILSINGHPMPRDMTSANALYDELKTTNKFVVKMVRNNARVTRVFQVKR